MGYLPVDSQSNGENMLRKTYHLDAKFTNILDYRPIVFTFME